MNNLRGTNNYYGLLNYSSPRFYRRRIINWLKKLNTSKWMIFGFLFGVGYNLSFGILYTELYNHWLVIGFHFTLLVIWAVIGLIAEHMSVCEAEQRMPNGRYWDGG